MRKCPECGTKLPLNDIFCSNCGIRITAEIREEFPRPNRVPLKNKKPVFARTGRTAFIFLGIFFALGSVGITLTFINKTPEHIRKEGNLHESLDPVKTIVLETAGYFLIGILLIIMWIIARKHPFKAALIAFCSYVLWCGTTLIIENFHNSPTDIQMNAIVSAILFLVLLLSYRYQKIMGYGTSTQEPQDRRVSQKRIGLIC